jgi:hypothetical protein
MKEALKKQLLFYLFGMLFVEVGLYIVTDFAYRLEIMPKIESQVSFYTAALCTPLLWGWISFIIPYVIIRKCQKCGSKNISSQRMGFESPVCDDCGHVFKANNLTKTIISFVIPTSFLGPSFLLGYVLAGEELSKDIIRFSILFSSVLPSVLAEIIYVAKFNNSEFVEEHEKLGSILSIILLLVLPILTLIGYGMILKFLFTGTI